MNRILVFLVSFFLCNGSIFAQKSLNLDFEYRHVNLYHGYILPQNWYAGGGGSSVGITHPDSTGYKVFLDNLEKHSGMYSLKMEMLGDKKNNNFGVFTGTLPFESFASKNVEFRGWIKTKDVKNGYAGLWFRVDGKNKKTLGIDNMHDRGLNGDNEWTQVSIKMKVKKNVTNINYGGLFTGEGTAWFDNLELYINGEKYIDFDF